MSRQPFDVVRAGVTSLARMSASDLGRWLVRSKTNMAQLRLP
jgi:hypothetical protein